jgi:hypothetical protein
MIREGTEVKWEWGNGSATGTVEEIHKEKISKTIDGSEVTREGSDDNPAYVIEQEDGGKVLKLQSEVERAD